MTSFQDDHQREYRLAGLAPAPDWPDGRCASLRDQLADRVATMIDARRVTLTWDSAGQPDRWGRLGVVATSSASPRETPQHSVQELLLAQGLAQFFPEPATRGHVRRFRRAEARARAGRLGVWGDDRLAEQAPGTVAQWSAGQGGTAERFAIVRGRLSRVDTVRQGMILRFFPNGWRGLSVRVALEARDRLPDQEMLALAGAHVRVRGRVRLLRPGDVEIVAREAAQIERLV